MAAKLDFGSRESSSSPSKLTLSNKRQTCEICDKQLRNAASLLIHYQQHMFMDNLIKNADKNFGSVKKRAKRA